MSDFLEDLVNELGPSFGSVAASGQSAGEFTGFIDTGCYMFNAILSGSIYGGLPNNKIYALAGEEATGKTYFALSIVKHFLQQDKRASVIYFDTESAITKDMLEDRGIDSKRVLISEPDTVQDFRTKALKMVAAYENQDPSKRAPVLMVLDSLGMLSTTKEMEDTAEGKETRDMTRSAIIKGCFRVLTLRFARAKIPMIITNHVYDAVGAYIPTKIMGGGSGLKYAASGIMFLSKKLDKDADKDVIGNFITVKMVKSRLTKANTKVELKLSYTKGLDRYYGLLDFATEAGIIKKVTAQSYQLPDGSKVKGTDLNRHPEKFFTEDLLKLIDDACHKEFEYGAADEIPEEDDGLEVLV